MTAEIQLSEQEHQTLQSANAEHGRTAFCDLFVVATFGPEIFIPPVAMMLPKAVRQGLPDVLAVPLEYRLDRIERVARVVSAADGYLIGYEKVYDEEDRLRTLNRREIGRDIYLTNIPPTRSHYHLLYLPHGTRTDAHRDTLELGDQLGTYADLFDSLNRERLAYLREIEEHRTAFMGQRVPVELGISMLRAYTRGFRQAAIEYRQSEVAEQADRFLYHLPFK